MTVTSGRPLHVPALARRLSTPLWERSQARMRDRFGFDLTSPQAQAVAASADAAPSAASAIDRPDALVIRAAVLSQSGDTAGALTAARAAAELTPNSARVLTTLAALLVNGGEPDQGLAVARQAVGLDSEDPQVVYNLALAEYFHGDRTAAHEHLLNAAALLGVRVTLMDKWRR